MRSNQGRTTIRADAVADRLPASAWHRRITLAVLALAFLAVLALAFLAALAPDATPARTAQPKRPARSPDPIDLTVLEIRHLFGTLLNPPNTSPCRLLNWSNRCGNHQATARRSHQQRRFAALSAG
ncbi:MULTISPECIES: hypothetical protein [unclassified Streptomyces]|uniref:hypothetical protein n=1 Tax=unclassified Streptomyces TaxID=2593676 RepID=UPI0035DD075F